MPMFKARSLVQEMRPDEGLFHDDAFGEGHAGGRAELRVTALDELPEPDRCQTRGHGVGIRRLELRENWLA